MAIFPLKQSILSDHAYKGCLAGKIKESFNKTTDSYIIQRIRRLYCDILEI